MHALSDSQNPELQFASALIHKTYSFICLKEHLILNENLSSPLFWEKLNENCP